VRSRAPKRNAMLRPETAETLRLSIQATQIKNALEKHVLKGSKMSASQVRAALGLLAMRIPTLAHVDTTIEDNRQRVVSGETLPDDQWEKQYGDSLATASGPSESTH
jgi:hypothetical protein